MNSCSHNHHTSQSATIIEIHQGNDRHRGAVLGIDPILGVLVSYHVHMRMACFELPILCINTPSSEPEAQEILIVYARTCQKCSSSMLIMCKIQHRSLKTPSKLNHKIRSSHCDLIEDYHKFVTTLVDTPNTELTPPSIKLNPSNPLWVWLVVAQIACIITCREPLALQSFHGYYVHGSTLSAVLGFSHPILTPAMESYCPCMTCVASPFSTS